jgi:hypothetical protein
VYEQSWDRAPSNRSGVHNGDLGHQSANAIDESNLRQKDTNRVLRNGMPKSVCSGEKLEEKRSEGKTKNDDHSAEDKMWTRCREELQDAPYDYEYVWRIPQEFCKGDVVSPLACGKSCPHHEIGNEQQA